MADRVGQAGAEPRTVTGVSGVLLAILVLCLLPELVLLGSDRGLWGTQTWRSLAYQNGAFWPGLLGNWRPNYPGQPMAMFLTYGFLHAGLWHLGLNMITLFSLGARLVARMGPWRFAALYAAAMLGGAVGFALLARVPQPMVGASGALFGLVGAMIGGDLVDRLRAKEAWLGALAGPVAGLVALNVLMYWAMGGQLAWQTHLGGFLAGWGAGALLTPRTQPGRQGGGMP